MKAALLGLALLLTASQSHAASREWRLFMLGCAGCHMADGMGQPHVGIPALPGNLSRFLHSDAGRAFLIQVPGTAQSAFSDAEVADLMNWMTGHFDPANLPPTFTRYSEAEVARLRAVKLDDVMATRARVVRELNERGVPVR